MFTGICGKSKNWPKHNVSVPSTESGSCWRALFNKFPGKSLLSQVTGIGLAKVGRVNRITKI